MIWFTSDTHFGHKNILQFQASRRQFQSVDEMDAVLIKNWNDRIGAEDIVYHLGDMSMAGAARTADILAALRGLIHLVRGNHDHGLNLANKSRFKSIQDYLEIKREKGKYIVLCHFPFATWRDSHWGSWHLHGHSHGSTPAVGKRLDVGVDCHDLAPISLDEVRVIMSGREVALTDYHGRPDAGDI